MLAAVVYFEVKDEVRKQLADLAAAREHLAGIVDAGRSRRIAAGRACSRPRRR